MKKYFCLCIFVFISSMLMNLQLISSLECIYCPTYSTEDECNKMNMTQICINETKCGYARFIEKREDIRPLFSNLSLLTVTFKKGCMEEDYCNRTQPRRKGADVIFSECVFCDEDLCTIKHPLLCVECNEKVDEYCAIQTERFLTCGPEEVCYGQRIQTASYLKRGCIEPSRCLKKDFCQQCNTDLCLMEDIWSSYEQNEPGKKKEKDGNYYGNASSRIREYFVYNVFFTMFSICRNSLTSSI